MTNKDLQLTQDHHTPDKEEVQDALGFLMSCSEADLIESWSRISIEWDLSSVSHVHKALCSTGRIHDLVEGFLRL